MYINISAETLEALNNCKKQQARILITLSNGKKLRYTEDDLVANGLTIDRYHMTGQMLELGNASSHQITLTLNGEAVTKINYNNSVIEASVIVNDETIRLGKFYTNEVAVGRDYVQLIGYDLMSTLDEECNWASFNFPNRVGNLATSLCASKQIQLVMDSPANYNEYIDSAPTIKCTYRQAISWCAQIMGFHFAMDNFGSSPTNKEINFGRYKPSGDARFVLTADMRYSSTLSSTASSVTGYTATINGVTYSGGFGTSIDLSSNALLANARNPQSILQGIRDKIGSFVYYPFSASTLAYPHVMPCDMVTFRDVKGNAYTSICSHMTYKLNAAGVVEGKGVSDTVADAQQDGLTNAEKTIIGTVDKKASEAKDTADTAQDTADDAQDDIDGVKDNIYYSGTTEINGGVIHTGSITADKINTTGLTAEKIEVKNASNVTIFKADAQTKQVVINAPVSAETISSNTTGGITNEIKLYNTGLRMSSNSSDNSKWSYVRTSADANPMVYISSSNGGNNAEIYLVGNNGSINIDGNNVEFDIQNNINITSYNEINIDAPTVKINGTPVSQILARLAAIEQRLGIS